MNKHELFESDRLLYKGIDEDDTDILVKWRSDPELIRYFRNSEPITILSHMDWYRNSYLGNEKRFDYIIIDKISGSKIGTVGASNIDFIKASCEISYMIAESDCRRKGFAHEAITAMTSKMREEKVNVFYAEIHCENTASVSLIKKLGWALDSQRGDFLLFVTGGR